MIINGKNIDIDILEADTAEKYSSALKYVKHSADEYKSGGSISDVIKAQCAVIYKFFDIILGDGESVKLFDDKKSLAVCIDAYEDFIKQASDICKTYTDKIKKAAVKRKLP